MKISKLQLATLSLLVSSTAFASELKVVDSTGATRLVAELPGQSRTALEVVAKSTAPTEGVEVQLSALESGGDIISIRLTSDGRGYFNAVPAGSFKVASTTEGVSIESVQLVNSDNTGLGMLANSQPADVVAPEVAAGGEIAGGEIVAGGGAGYGLGAGGIVLAGGGAIAIAATAISEGTDDSTPGAARPTPTPRPPVPDPTPVPTPRPPRPPSGS